MRDESLEQYASAIEEHLAACRGTAHVLSPRDFALVRAWHTSRLPLVTVLAGIDLAYQGSDSAPTSVAFCRARVEALAASLAPPASASRRDGGAGSAGETRERLQGMLDALARHDARAARVALDPARVRAQELLDLLTVSARPNWEYVSRKLGEIDEAVSRAAREVVGGERLAGYRSEAARALERQRGRVDERALEDAISGYETTRAREELGLPRVATS